MAGTLAVTEHFVVLIVLWVSIELVGMYSMHMQCVWDIGSQMHVISTSYRGLCRLTRWV